MIAGILAGPIAADGGGGGGDPYWDNVVLLMGYHDTNFTDESPTAKGNATKISDPESNAVTTKFGNTLGLDGNDALTFADHDDFSFGSGDFTVETWFRGTQAVEEALVSKWNTTGNQREWALSPSLTTSVSFYYSTTGANAFGVGAAVTVSLNTWYHCAFSRVGNTGYLCFNGTIIATGDMTGVTLFSGSTPLNLGSQNNGTVANLTGFLDETRITKGVGRYSGAVNDPYPVPASAFPRGTTGPDENTAFLCHFDTAVPTDEMTATAGTLVGNANCDTANSELVLDGTGDWCTFPDLAAFDLNGGDFTVEWHANVAATEFGAMFSRESASSKRYVAFLPGNGNLDFYEGDDGSHTLAVAGVNGTRRHWAWVRDGGTQRLYCDGVQGATSARGAPDAGNAILYIGTDAFDTPGRAIAGRIARFKISNICRYPDGTTFTPPAHTDD